MFLNIISHETFLWESVYAYPHCSQLGVLNSWTAKLTNLMGPILSQQHAMWLVHSSVPLLRLLNAGRTAVGSSKCSLMKKMLTSRLITSSATSRENCAWTQRGSRTRSHIRRAHIRLHIHTVTHTLTDIILISMKSSASWATCTNKYEELSYSTDTGFAHSSSLLSPFRQLPSTGRHKHVSEADQLAWKYLILALFRRAILTHKVGQTGLVLVYYEGTL